MPRKARRRSFGSITEVSRGRKYIVRWPQNTERGRSRPSKTIYGTYRDADRFLAQMQLKVGDERPVATIGQACELWYLPWLDRQESSKKIKQRTAEMYRESWRNICSPIWDNVPVDKIRPDKYQEWLLTLNKGRANIAVVVMRKIVDLCVRNNMLQENVFRRDYDMPAGTTRKKIKAVYSLEEANEILTILRGSLAEAPYIISCFGGARVGEACGVKCSEIRVEQMDGRRYAIVPINRRMPKTGCDPLPDGDLKTPESKRETIIPQPYCDRLIELIEQRTEFGTDWLAMRDDGLPLNTNSFMYRFRQSVGDKAIPLSNLRATWRTIGQFEWKVPSDTLEVLMGHILEGVSGKHYIRPTMEDLLGSFDASFRMT